MLSWHPITRKLCISIKIYNIFLIRNKLFINKVSINNNKEKTALMLSCFKSQFKYNIVINTINNNIRFMYSKTLSLLLKIIFIVKSPLQEIKIIQIKINTPSLNTNFGKLHNMFSFK